MSLPENLKHQQLMHSTTALVGIMLSLASKTTSHSFAGVISEWHWKMCWIQYLEFICMFAFIWDFSQKFPQSLKHEWFFNTKPRKGLLSCVLNKLLKENVLNYFMSSDTAVQSFKLGVQNKQKDSVILNIFITKVYFAVQSSCLLFLYDCH